MPTIVIASPTTFDLERARVWTAPELVRDDGAGGTLGPAWTPRPYLYVQELHRVAAPDIDQCQLSYYAGDFALREPDLFGGAATAGQFNPLELHRQYVKVELLDHAGTVIDQWYGVLEVDARSYSRDARDPLNPLDDLLTGEQRLTAYGLLRELETTFVDGSRVQDAAGVPHTIGRGLPFNKFLGQAFAGGAMNQTVAPVADGDDEEYVFSWVPAETEDSVEFTADRWTAATAARYLLHYYPPRKADGTPTATWTLLGAPEGYLWWSKLRLETERRSVKSLLDELIDRRRLVGYWVDGFELADGFEVRVRVFGFAPQAIPLAVGEIAANADPVELELEASVLVEDPELRTIGTHQVDLVRVEGEYVTSTLSVPFDRGGVLDPSGFAKGWTAAHQAEYDGADSLGRLQDHLQNVYERFVLDRDWGQRVDDDAGGRYYVTIAYDDLPDTLADADVAGLFDVAGASAAGNWWHRGKRFLDWLVLQPTAAETDTEYRRPFAVFEEVELGAGDELTGLDVWRFAEDVSEGAEDRGFNLSLRLTQDILGIRLRVNVPAGQQLIARGVFAGAVDDDRLDPNAAGLSYEHLRFTGTLEWDDRVRVEERIATPPGQDRVRLIAVPDARLDFLLPGTVTDIDSAGALVASPGEVVRDDRDRLRDIAAAAAAWYGSPRKALTCSYHRLAPSVELGQLITNLTLQGVTTEVNTPVTGLTLDFRRGTTRIETSYADADFV